MYLFRQMAIRVAGLTLSLFWCVKNKMVFYLALRT